MDDLMKAIVGVDASSYVLTHNDTLARVYNGSLDALQVVMGGMTFADGLLKVKDDKLIEVVSTQLSTISKYLSESATKTVSVTINDIPEVAIDKNIIAEAMKMALYEGDTAKNFSPMLKMMSDGTLQIKSVSDPVMVKNSTGEKLQVSNLVW
jgi:hypothetical protein